MVAVRIRCGDSLVGDTTTHANACKARPIFSCTFLQLSHCVTLKMGTRRPFALCASFQEYS